MVSRPLAMLPDPAPSSDGRPESAITPRKHSRWQVAGVAIECWEEAGAPGVPSQDQSLIHCARDRLRLAVIDGCTPTPETPRYLGVDGATWAASVIRATLHAEHALGEAIRAANEFLFDPRIESSRARPQAVFVVAELTGDRVELVRGGDCEAWVERAGRWERVFERSMLASWSERAYRRWKHENPEAGRIELFAIEEEILGVREAWNSTALGRFPEPLVERATIEGGFSRLLLASDGARLDHERVHRLEHWLERLRHWEHHELRDHPSSKVHDDVTVLRASPEGHFRLRG
jgi:hypothetical protein